MSTCPICRTGRLQKRSMAFVEWHDRYLLIVNRMPAMVCEVCHEQVYDYEAIEILQKLLWSVPPNLNRAISSRNS
ncbi:MAG: YgiT-type zinc finger protein [Chloroflexi bacterium]|nr:YgiT-type zinc finger protein [Chloroflexota bacterium]